MHKFSLDEFRKQAWTDEALIQLGHENLGHIIALLRKEEGGDSHDIGYVRKSLEILQGKDEKALEAASDFAIHHAALMATLPVPGGKRTSLDSSAYKYGHTTFQQCGQCEYACSWTGAGVGCRFLGHLSDQAAPYDSPCLLRRGKETERVIEALQQKINAKLKMQKAERGKTRNWIDRLLAVKRASKSQPVLPIFRSGETFYVFGDRVLVYTGFPVFGKHQNRWAPATILRGLREIAVVLDEPLLPANTHSRKYWIKKEWARILWHVNLRSPFVLQKEDLTILAALEAGNALKQLWIKSAEGWYIEDPAGGNDATPDAATFGKCLDLSLVMQSAEPDKRMMSGFEAASLLGFTYMPAQAEEVVGAFRCLKGIGAAPKTQLEQAKSTLLLRIYGCSEVGG
ncbi:hypothetical protein HYW59_02985 [Candidatus Kaiserbacteria bacterium]|nr:hypothetical protein [Candidatus Kaiserbacteria bacterium]